MAKQGNAHAGFHAWPLKARRERNSRHSIAMQHGFPPPRERRE
jgi:hypothetical protein